ncbi:MAG: hypothetical protein H6708_08800 [Kofleriaceae bacterium]|nr:hypothetical protein [Kofleriaceae bacterium]
MADAPAPEAHPLLRWLPGGGWRGAVIVAFVALQALAPLDYYCVRRDKHDERFAWRMFSPTRMLTCQPTFTVDDQPVDLAGTFHEAWIQIARRGRLVVLEAMGQRLCKLNPGKRVVVDLRCRTVDGRVEQRGGFDLCSVPEI